MPHNTAHRVLTAAPLVATNPGLKPQSARKPAGGVPVIATATVPVTAGEQGRRGASAELEASRSAAAQLQALAGRAAWAPSRPSTGMTSAAAASC